MLRRTGHPRWKADAGLTLIELVVAMAIFALVAVMGLQTMTGAIRMRDRLSALDDQTAALGLALGMMRADLGAAVPMLFYPPAAAPQSALSFVPDAAGLAVSLAGQPALIPRAGAGLQRAEWRVEAGVLKRRAWPALYPARTDEAGPWVKVLDGVRDLTVRSYFPDLGWVSGVSGNQVQVAPDLAGSDVDDAIQTVANSYSSNFPLAVEVTLATDAFGSIVLLESLR